MIKTLTLTQHRMLTHDVMELLWQMPEPLLFLPGQYLTMLIPTKEGRKLGRSYSIANLPDTAADTVRIVTKLVPGGLASDFFAAAAVGATVDFVGPTGKFVVAADPSSTLFVATGTGNAPFYPMISQLLAISNLPVILLMGVRSEEDIFDADYFVQLTQQQPSFQFLLTLSRPSAGWSGQTGRVTQLLSQQPQLLRDRQIYICGSGSMINDVVALAQEQGVSESAIFYEKYNNL